LDQNSSGEIRVVDYKTGSSHLEPKDLKTGTRLQLPLYALAAQKTLMLGSVTEGFYWKIQGAEASTLKLSKFKTEQGEGVEDAIRVAVEHLERILAGVRAAEFPPIPPKGGCPSYCPAAIWCWRYQPRWGGAK
jgi:RecB family exonuclease